MKNSGMNVETRMVNPGSLVSSAKYIASAAMATRRFRIEYVINTVWITPALTEASKSIEVVKMESDTMVAKRTSDD